MKNECSVIRDLLSLYAEEMVSSDTARFIESHLKDCSECSEELRLLKEPERKPVKNDAAPLQKLARKIKAQKIQTAVLAAAFAAALILCAFAVLDSPEYLPYSEELLTFEPQPNGSVVIAFDRDATDFSCMFSEDPNGENITYCYISAWKSPWREWFSAAENHLAASVTPPDSRPVVFAYAPNDGSEIIYAAEYNPADGSIVKLPSYDTVVVLPRLALSYYFLIAVGALIILWIAWAINRKKTAVRVFIERIGLYPAAYILSFFIVTGISPATYSMQRDFFLILLISVIFYIGLLLAYNVFRLKKEIKEISGRC